MDFKDTDFKYYLLPIDVNKYSEFAYGALIIEFLIFSLTVV